MIAAALGLLLVLAMAYDAAKYVIPNPVVLAMLVLYPLHVWFSGVEWLGPLVAALVAFAIGFGMYSLRWMGGGDVKLLAACVLWVGIPVLPAYLVYVGVLGGILAVVLLLVRGSVRLYFPALLLYPWWPRMFISGAPVPYGLAIAGAVWLVWVFHPSPLPRF